MANGKAPIEHMNPRAADVASNLIAQVRQRLGEEFERFTGEDIDLIEQCAADAGVLYVAAGVAPGGAEAQLKLLREKAQIHAQLLNIASIESSRAASVFWDVFREIAGSLVAVAFAAL
jgi:pyruvate/2-oxoacid:ferredoxin oxidoreductase alpha subunit